MFEAVRNNKRITQFILAIIIVPFAFFGMDAYFSGGPGGGEVATVGGNSITVAEFDRALRDQQDRIRTAQEGDFDRELLESPAFRYAVLDNLINQRVLAYHADQSRLNVPAAALQRSITEQSAFQQDGSFSLERYQTLLQAQGMSPAQFEARLAYDIRTQKVIEAVSGSGFAGQEPVRRLAQAQLEERDVSRVILSVEELMAEVELADDAAHDFYLANSEQFERPARVRAEYVVLDEAAVMAGIEADEARARQAYDADQERFGQPEERRARHILVRVDADADEEEQAQARERIDALAAELAEDPTRFEEVAREASEDPGSARAGGDLGFFGPGVMVPEFEEVAFALEEDAISEPVRSDFGYHIIQVTDIRAGTVQPFDEVRDELVTELQRQEAAAQYPLLAEQFANTVYEQPDSLEPAAEALGLEIHTSDWVMRGGDMDGYEDERLVRGLFSNDALEYGENVEAIEVERGVLVSARVLEFEEAALLEFEDVRAEIEERLRFEGAAQLAREQGEELLAAARAGEADAQWEEGITLQRGTPGLPENVTRAVFGASAETLPAYVGVAEAGDYVVYRIDEVRQASIEDDDARMQLLAAQYDRLIGELDVEAYLMALREAYDVEIHAAALEESEAR